LSISVAVLPLKGGVISHACGDEPENTILRWQRDKRVNLESIELLKVVMQEIEFINGY
jgi:hypothetical protein